MNVNQVHVGTLGGHSALEIALGAKMQGLKAVVVCQKGREKTYTEYYADLFDEVILVDKFRDLTTKAVIKKLQALNTVMVQSRYFWVYCDHEAIEKNFPVPIFGRRGLVKREERNVPRNQYYLMDKAGIRRPKIYQDPRKINRLVLVKAAEATRTYERAFFLATSYKDYQNQALQLIKEGRITKSGLKQAVIEEFILGVSVNFNFFYSPLKKRLELLGTDTRRATNINGLVNLPANEQLEILKYLRPQYVEAGHMAVTVKESVLEQAFTSGEKLVKVLQQEFPPGIIGSFALQTIYVPGPPKEDLVTFDLSLRMPGSPGIIATPYSNYLFGRPVSLGERIAMEIRTAIEGNKLELVVS